MSFSPVKWVRIAAWMAVLGCVLGVSWRARADGWPSLHLRGVPMKSPSPEYFDYRDTVLSLYHNQDNVVSLVWDRDSVSEARPDFGGYSVWRSIGPDTVNMILLRRYILRPADKYGDSQINQDNGSVSRFWTWLDNRAFASNRAYAGMFEDPDSILAFDRILQQIGVDVSSGLGIFDTVYTRKYVFGPKNGFEYYYSVTVCDTTDNAEDITPRSANFVGPLIPTGPVVQNNLDRVKVVPNPYVFRSDWDLPDHRKIRFTNLPPVVTIEIYTADGARVRVMQHNNPLDNGQDWDLKNGNGEDVSSGMYLFRVATPDGRERVSRFTVVR